MVASAEVQPNGLERERGELLGQIHRDLTREHHLVLARLSLQQFDSNPEVCCHCALDVIHRHCQRINRPEQAAQDLLGKFNCRCAPIERDFRDEANEASFQLPHTRGYVACDVLEHVAWYLDAFVVAFPVENRQSHFVVGRLDVGGQTPLETRNQALVHIAEFLRRTVAGQDDLLAELVECVEGVEEVVLCFFFALEKLDVVHNEHINTPVEGGEFVGLVVLDSVDVLHRKAFARGVEHTHRTISLDDTVANCLDKVRFPQPRGAVDHQWVEARFSWFVSNGARS